MSCFGCGKPGYRISDHLILCGDCEGEWLGENDQNSGDNAE